MAEQFLDARQAALNGLFDDAAVFPPANRPMEDALASHRGHQGGDRGWLVNRFLIRASQAGELPELLEDPDELQLGVVLGRTAGGTFAECVGADLASITGLARDRRIRLTGLELSLDGDDAEGEVAGILAALQGARFPENLTLAIEVPVSGRSAGEVLRGISAIAGARAPGGRYADGLIAKVRCGGTVASAIPADLEVAGFIRACAKEQVPFKATAGLHHPSRTTNEDHGGLEHGFLNVLAAATAAFQGERLDVVEDHLGRAGDQFKLGPGAMIVGDDVVEGQTLAAVRAQFFRGIGCCDILDPITDLAQMGVVTATGGLS